MYENNEYDRTIDMDKWHNIICVLGEFWSGNASFSWDYLAKRIWLYLEMVSMSHFNLKPPHKIPAAVSQHVIGIAMILVTELRAM